MASLCARLIPQRATAFSSICRFSSIIAQNNRALVYPVSELIYRCNKCTLLQVSTPQLFSGRTVMARPKKEKITSKAKPTKFDIFKTVSLEELTELIEYDVMCAKMQKTLEHLEQELVEKVNIRTSTGAYDKVKVVTADGTFDLMELAQIVKKNPQTIIINVDANPQYVKEVKKALTSSDLNTNAQQEGTTFFLPLTKITREHREGLAKTAKSFGAKSKESLRNIQSSYEKKLKNAKLGKDKQFQVHEAIATTFQKYSADSEKVVEKKMDDLLM